MSILKREPVVVINALVTVITSTIMLLVAFGLPMTKEQSSTLITLIGAVGALIATLVSRSQVTPVANPKDNQDRPLKP